MDVGKSNMSSFCSLTEEQKEVSHVMEVCVVVAIKLFALGEIPLSSSRTSKRLDIRLKRSLPSTFSNAIGRKSLILDCEGVFDLGIYISLA